jgi:hypothetical protein
VNKLASIFLLAVTVIGLAACGSGVDKKKKSIPAIDEKTGEFIVPQLSESLIPNNLTLAIPDASIELTPALNQAKNSFNGAGIKRQKVWFNLEVVSQIKNDGIFTYGGAMYRVKTSELLYAEDGSLIGKSITSSNRSGAEIDIYGDIVDGFMYKAFMTMRSSEKRFSSIAMVDNNISLIMTTAKKSEIAMGADNPNFKSAYSLIKRDIPVEE